ncbi:MAG: DUF1963 domain-containing protein [Planctomycetota bacterium]
MPGRFERKIEEASALVSNSPFATIGDAVIASLLPQFGLSSSPWLPDALPIGHSHFGGPADLPKGQAWPVDREGRPLALLMQINLADFARPYGHHLADALPGDGWLCLFLDMHGPGQGQVGQDASVSAFQFTGDVSGLLRLHADPSPDTPVWTTCHALTVYPADHNVGLPSLESIDCGYQEYKGSMWRRLTGRKLSDEDHDELVFAIDDLARTRHDVRLLGSPTLFNPDPRRHLEDPENWMLLVEFSGECPWLVGATKPSPHLDRPKIGNVDYLQYFVRKSDFQSGILDRGRFEWMLT